MKLSHRHEGETQVIAVADELGHHEARQIIDYMETTLSLHPEGPVVLDLSGLTFMDSSGKRSKLLYGMLMCGCYISFLIQTIRKFRIVRFTMCLLLKTYVAQHKCLGLSY